MKKVILVGAVLAQSLMCHNKIDEFVFGPAQAVGNASIAGELYGQIVATMPILCVDILVYDVGRNAYLMVKRESAPAQGEFWILGGRLLKNESILAAALRKCEQEAGISAQAIKAAKIVGTYSTVFPDSAWGCPTHTVNIAVAVVVENIEVHLNNLHTASIWVPIDARPVNEYLAAIYDDLSAITGKNS